MILVKTELGQQTLRERHGVLSQRQRSAFILFDGSRSLQQVLDATAVLGITEADVQFMIDSGLLALAGPAQPARASRLPQDQATIPGEGGAGGGRSEGERYQKAYLIASELTAGLGLRGFRLHLAVERAAGYEALTELAPKIREAVGEARYRPLEQALFA